MHKALRRVVDRHINVLVHLNVLVNSDGVTFAANYERQLFKKHLHLCNLHATQESCAYVCECVLHTCHCAFLGHF